MRKSTVILKMASVSGSGSKWWQRVGRTPGSTFPPSTGPTFDHTFGNESGIIHI